MSKSRDDLTAQANLTWLLVASGRIPEAIVLRSTLDAFDAVGLALLDAALEIRADNFGVAVKHLDAALKGDQEALAKNYFEDFLRLLRLAEARAYGERLIAWFDETGHADRQAPACAAFVAFVRGKRFLLDFSPEVRGPAERIYGWLMSQRTNLQPVPTEQMPKSKRRRGRPPKRRGG